MTVAALTGDGRLVSNRLTEAMAILLELRVDILTMIDDRRRLMIQNGITDDCGTLELRASISELKGKLKLIVANREGKTFEFKVTDTDKVDMANFLQGAAITLHRQGYRDLGVGLRERGYGKAVVVYSEDGKGTFTTSRHGYGAKPARG